jgi:hypothetical protein
MERMFVELMRPWEIGEWLKDSRINFWEAVWHDLTCKSLERPAGNYTVSHYFPELHLGNNTME